MFALALFLWDWPGHGLGPEQNSKGASGASLPACPPAYLPAH